MHKTHRPVFIFEFNHYHDVIRVSFYCSLKMASEEVRNVRNKLITITLALIFMIEVFTASQLYRLPKYRPEPDQKSPDRLTTLVSHLMPNTYQ